MKQSRYSDSQIMSILKQAESGIPVPALCREHGMSSATFYKWRAKYGGMDTSMIARVKELEAENARLKKMYAEEKLKAQIIQEAMAKKVVKPSQRKEMAQTSIKDHRISIRMACSLFQLSETCFRYERLHDDENGKIAQWLIQLTSTWRNWGFKLCFLYLRNVKGFGWNHKRVYRIYRELELNLRIKPKKRLVREKPDALTTPATINEVWSMDFMYDQLDNQKSYRLFNVIDDHNREGLSMEVDYSLPAERVIRSLDQLMEWRGKPKRLRCDNGPEYISHKLKAWAEKHEIELCYIQPGNPQQNAYIERFNRTVRYDLLNQDLFSTIEEVQEKVTNWLWHYNNERPNMALGGITPAQKLRCVAFNNSTF